MRRTALSLHGTKTLSIAVSHNDSHITAQGFSASAPQTLTPDPQTIPILVPAPTIALTRVQTPDAHAIPLLLPAPTIVFGGISKTPDPVTIPLVLTAPTIHVVKTPDPQAIMIVIPAPTIDVPGAPGAVTTTCTQWG